MNMSDIPFGITDWSATPSCGLSTAAAASCGLFYSACLPSHRVLWGRMDLVHLPRRCNGPYKIYKLSPIVGALVGWFLRYVLLFRLWLRKRWI